MASILSGSKRKNIAMVSGIVKNSKKNKKNISPKITDAVGSEKTVETSSNSSYCTFCSLEKNLLHKEYHDNEWGKPSHDDRHLFEMLTLEGAQAGLSWTTILNKRESYRIAFDNFDIDRVSKYEQKKIDELLLNPGIVRNKLKINSTIKNAQLVLEIQKEYGSFNNFLWQYVDNSPIDSCRKTNEASLNDVKDVFQFNTTDSSVVSTPLSDLLAKDLKKRGFKFVGTTIMHAFMQAVGMINSHDRTCKYRY